LVPALAGEVGAAHHHFVFDTFMNYEQRVQRIESVWPDLRAVTSKQSDGTYAAVLLNRAGSQVDQRWLASPNPLVEIVGADPIGTSREQEASSVARANELLAREFRTKNASHESNVMPSRVTMDFGDFVTDSFRDPVVPPNMRQTGTAYSTFHTVLRDAAGQDIGILRWFDEQQVLVWRINNLGAYGEGLVTPKRLERIGGWPFIPDMVWSGIQALAFRDSALRSQSRDLARMKSLRVTTLGLLPKINSCDGLPDGCTGLHFLDGTVYQDCCDQHDICYEYNPPDGCCSAWSWIFPNSWHCLTCNIEVVYCFLTTSLSGGGGSGGGGLRGGDGGCSTGGTTAWCPPECFSCTSGVRY
jgi:hypothetical protein